MLLFSGVPDDQQWIDRQQAGISRTTNLKLVGNDARPKLTREENSVSSVERLQPREDLVGVCGQERKGYPNEVNFRQLVPSRTHRDGD